MQAFLKYPSGTFVTSAAKSLMSNLLTDSDHRLDYTQIKKHVFFRDTDWENIRKSMSFTSSFFKAVSLV